MEDLTFESTYEKYFGKRKNLAEEVEMGVREKESITKEFLSDMSNLFSKWSDLMKSITIQQGRISQESFNAIAEDTLELLKNNPKELFVDTKQLREIKEIEFDLRRVAKALLKV